MKETIEETIGARIAHLRRDRGWTQQALAERIAISRVAISHIEMDLSTPSERTIALLAGVFKLSPREVVAGTTYPQAKTERLPFVVCRHTELELKVALLRRDVSWLERLQEAPDWPRLAEMVWQTWAPRLAEWRRTCVVERERQLLASARRQLLAGCRRETMRERPVKKENR